MTSAEKILSGILDDANAAAAEKLREAETQASEILSDARAQADRITAERKAAAEAQAETLSATGKSGAALIVRDAALACRRELIDGVLSAAAEKLRHLPDEEYFDFLASVARSSGSGGELMLSDRDGGRNCALLREKLAGTAITLSEKTVPIDGGFILKNGEIEINASFEALIHEKRGELVDSVNRVLFS